MTRDFSFLQNVHSPDKCRGYSCIIHNPSDHHMREWPMVWREWHGYFERTCPHGIGHPDPDDVAYRLRIGDRSVGVHGCDGCCARGAVDDLEPNRIRVSRRLKERGAEDSKTGRRGGDT